MITAKSLFLSDASNPIVRALVRVVSKANNSKYRAYYVPRYGCFMYLNLSEPLTLRRLLGRYEMPVFRLINWYLKPGMVFVDVGANLGDYTLIASRLVGDGGKVVSFEPDPSNYAWLTKSIARNAFVNIEARQEALSDQDGEATLFLGDVSGWHTLKAVQRPSARGEVTVKTRKLDNVLFDRIDLMKIDVEGAEFDVISGARESLARHRPVLIIDLHPTKGADIPGLLQLLIELQYRIYGLTPRGECVPYAEHLLEIIAAPPKLAMPKIL